MPTLALAECAAELALALEVGEDTMKEEAVHVARVHVVLVCEADEAAMSDEVVRRAEARVGSCLREKWRLDSLVGVGGMAAVYAATHRNGSRGAVKMLHPELSIDAESRERFLREGYVANKVGHPGAVSVIDDDVADGAIFLVMELLEGVALVNLLELQPTGTLPLHAALAVTDQLLSILASAHDKEIIHRDIKPENVFITSDARVKLLDFGIARIREASAAHRTKTGHALGTPAFMPPEQAAGKWKEVGPASDLWSVGATLFNMLTARTVHEAETVPILMVAAITKPAPPLASVLADVPSDVADLVDRALAFAPSDRFRSAGEMRAVLRQSLERHPGLSILGVLERTGSTTLSEPITHDGDTQRPLLERVPNDTPTTVAAPSRAGGEGPTAAAGISSQPHPTTPKTVSPMPFALESGPPAVANVSAPTGVPAQTAGFAPPNDMEPVTSPRPALAGRSAGWGLALGALVLGVAVIGLVSLTGGGESAVESVSNPADALTAPARFEPAPSAPVQTATTGSTASAAAPGVTSHPTLTRPTSTPSVAPTPVSSAVPSQKLPKPKPSLSSLYESPHGPKSSGANAP